MNRIAYETAMKAFRVAVEELSIYAKLYSEGGISADDYVAVRKVRDDIGAIVDKIETTA